MQPPVLLIHHGGNRGRDLPQNSLAALERCLRAGARVVEVDITPTADGEFALLHDAVLDGSTTGRGRAIEHASADLAGLRLLWKGRPSEEPIGLLGQALDLLAAYPEAAELQLDLKADEPLPTPLLARLAAQVRPLRERVRLTSCADWALGRLRELDADLPLGFDPGWYIDYRPEPYDPPEPPLRTGAYGYLDDHPQALKRWGTTPDYLTLRAECLLRQAPARAGVWYLHGRLVEQSLRDGFDWIAWLHDHGIEADVWTLDAETPGHVEGARLLAGLGVDRITTNDPPALAAALGTPAVY